MLQLVAPYCFYTNSLGTGALKIYTSIWKVLYNAYHYDAKAIAEMQSLPRSKPKAKLSNAQMLKCSVLGNLLWKHRQKTVSL